MAVSQRPFYRVVKAFTETYHMRAGVAVYHLMICLACGHWRRIHNTATSTDVVGRLFSCTRCK